MNEHEKPQIDFMHKLARQIVERRNLVFLFVVLATIFTVFAVKWVKVETDMTTYLPKTSAVSYTHLTLPTICSV